ncbi:hypothetical protein H8B02_22030 [Bradyrhizobium sp. Pear77]|uniref:hypothetical protein n=1 Tax=Bradyrhizobium TaxID=374 RepID=UPI001E324CC3|nr:MULTISPECIES: hypothetical protein [Bradyrhizobium]MCC8956010.1 hypothetical protein [Bradyrhizobium altum]MCC8967567.1 hypothetical protein [Bradyrhizobium oropedii]
MIFDADDKDGLSGVGVSPAQAQIVDPAVWAQENPPLLTREYETDAKNVARARAALAGARLANLIETALK